MSTAKLSIGDFQTILGISRDLHKVQMGELAINSVLQKLRQLTSAHRVLLQIVSGLLPGSQPAVRLTVTAGWNDPQERQSAENRAFTDPSEHPLWNHLTQHSATPDPVTLAREQLADDGQWYSSAFFLGWCRDAGVDHCVLSGTAMPRPGWVTVLELYQRYGSNRIFNERERSIAHLLNLELSRHLCRCPAYTLAPTAAVNLTPRMQDVLNLLLAGSSEKETAQQLGLSIHTVHTYCVALYRRYGVHSRGELMSKFVHTADQGILSRPIGSA